MKFLKARYSLAVSKTIGLLLLCLLSWPNFAQNITSTRVELPLSEGSEDEFNVISYGEKGVLVLNPQTNNLGYELNLNFAKYDTTLYKVWQGSYTPPKNYKLLKYFDTENHLYCLLKLEDKNNIIIVRIDVQNGDYIVVESKMLTNMSIEIFTVVKSKALIGGKFNERPVVELVNLFDQNAKVLPDIHANDIKLNNIEVNQSSGSIYVLLKNTRNCRMLLNVYNYEGKLEAENVLGEKNQLPVNGRLLKMPDNNFILAGNYADNCSDYSIGFYTHQLTGENQTHFYDFTTLSNYLNYMSEKRQTRVKNRISNKKLKGKDFKLRQRLLLHEPVPSADGMILIGEAFYPEYKSNTGNFYPYPRNYRWANYYTNNYNNFRYTHALLCGFDKNGKLMWDNSINMKDIQSRTLDPKVQITKHTGFDYIVAYPDNGIIKTAKMKTEEAIEHLENLDLKQAEDRIILDTYDSELAAWYDHNFIAYGFQSIRSSDGLYARQAFFLNKISYY